MCSRTGGGRASRLRLRGCAREGCADRQAGAGNSPCPASVQHADSPARARYHHRRGPYPARAAVGAQGSAERARFAAVPGATGQPVLRQQQRPIEYRYANYDVAQAEADYRAVADEIAALQLELDLVNQTEVFSVEL